MNIAFQKMHGLGNDFVIVDARCTSQNFDSGAIRHLADRRRGIGCDQFVLLSEARENVGQLFMKIYNPDGTEAGACGNATRCVADMYMRKAGRTECKIETVSGVLACTRTGDLIAVNMGPPRLEWNQIPLSKQCDTLHLPLPGDPVGVSMGNPHCVYFCDNAEEIAVDKLGPKTEHDPLFPERTNVEYVSMLGKDHIRMRVWERGAGVTQACGTGACAAVVAAIRRGLTDQTVTVTLDGGDLTVEWSHSSGDVTMTGPVAYSFEGTMSVA